MLQISQLLSSAICPYVLSEQDGDESCVWLPIKYPHFGKEASSFITITIGSLQRSECDANEIKVLALLHFVMTSAHLTWLAMYFVNT